MGKEKKQVIAISDELNQAIKKIVTPIQGVTKMQLVELVLRKFAKLPIEKFEEKIIQMVERRIDGT